MIVHGTIIPILEQGGCDLDVTGSIHIVPRLPRVHGATLESSTGQSSPVRAGSDEGEGDSLLVTTQSNPRLAPATSLAPGFHIMCHVHHLPRTLLRGETPNPESCAPILKVPAEVDTWRSFWTAVLTDPALEAEAERLAWQRPCIGLLKEAAQDLESTKVSAVLTGTPERGWARVSCAPSGNVVCSLAAGEATGEGEVVWFHHPADWTEDEEAALLEGLVLKS